MNRNQPFLTGFSARLCGRSRASAQARLRREADLISDRPITDNARLFAPFLPPAWMRQLHGQARHRHFDPSVTFWAWIDQILEGNASCSKAVSRVQAWCVEKRRPVPASSTGAYCMARQRL